MCVLLLGNLAATRKSSAVNARVNSTRRSSNTARKERNPKKVISHVVWEKILASLLWHLYLFLQCVPMWMRGMCLFFVSCPLLCVTFVLPTVFLVRAEKSKEPKYRDRAKERQLGINPEEEALGRELGANYQ